MFTFLIVLQVLLAVSLCVLVLLQHGKGADMGAAFGSGASATVFGARGSGSFLSRATAVLAAAFFINSLVLATPLVLGEKRAPASVVESIVNEKQKAADPAPDAKPVETTEAPAVSETAAPVTDVPAVPESDLPDVPTTESEVPAP